MEYRRGFYGGPRYYESLCKAHDLSQTCRMPAQLRLAASGRWSSDRPKRNDVGSVERRSATRGVRGRWMAGHLGCGRQGRGGGWPTGRYASC